MDNRNYKITKCLLLEFMKDEQAAADYYQQLSEMLTNEQYREIVEKIRDDEIKHYLMLRELYTRFYRCNPETMPAAANTPDNAEAAIKIAIEDGLNAYEEYRNTYLTSCDNYARGVFFELMSDEIEHSVWLTYLLHLI